MGLFISVLVKIVIYVLLLGTIHYFIHYAQTTLTKPKKRIIATDQLLYTAVEEKLKENLQLDIKNEINKCEGNIINTTPIDNIPTDLNENTDIPVSEIDMKEQLKNFLKNSSQQNNIPNEK
jgi:hypothetical protein